MAFGILGDDLRAVAQLLEQLSVLTQVAFNFPAMPEMPVRRLARGW